MISALAVVTVGGLAEIGNVILTVLYYAALVIGCWRMLVGAVRVLSYLATRRREPLNVVIAPPAQELGADTLAMLRGEVPDAEIERWLGEGGRNG